MPPEFGAFLQALDSHFGSWIMRKPLGERNMPQSFRLLMTMGWIVFETVNILPFTVAKSWLAECLIAVTTTYHHRENPSARN